MHKHKKYTYTVISVKLCGAIRFPVVDKIENPLGVKKTLRLKTWGYPRLSKDVKPC